MTKFVEHNDGGLNLNAQIESRAMKPDLCTIYPPESDDAIVMEQWITASEGSYIDAVLMR